MSERPKSTDVSLYTSLMIDNNFYNKTEVDTKISEIKNEIPEDVDLSNYLEKNTLSWDINDSREILKLEYCGKEEGTQFYIEDNFHADKVSGWYIKSYKDILSFKQNSMNSMFKTIEFKYNGIFFEGNKLITESEADAKYTLKTEIPEVNLNSYYTKSESDNKYALKTDIPTVPFNVVDNMIEPTKT